jgi:hypothetical protein
VAVKSAKSAKSPTVWLRDDRCDLCGYVDRCLCFGYSSAVDDILVKLCWRCLCFVRGKMMAFAAEVGSRDVCVPFDAVRARWSEEVKERRVV